MPHIHASTSPLGWTSPLASGLLHWLDGVSSVIGALLHSGPLVRDVEAMGKLLRQANRVEARKPEIAAALRRKAERMVR